MNKQEILLEIMNDPELKEYWSKIDVNKVNMSNISSVDRTNQYLSMLKLLLDDNLRTPKQIKNNILETIS